MRGGSGCRPRILSTRGREAAYDDRKAAGACLDALWRLRPPRLLGRVDFKQDHAVRNWATYDGLKCAPHGNVELRGKMVKMTGWAGPKHERDLGECETGE